MYDYHNRTYGFPPTSSGNIPSERTSPQGPLLTQNCPPHTTGHGCDPRDDTEASEDVMTGHLRYRRRSMFPTSGDSGTACSVAIGHRALEGYRLNMTEIPGESLDLILLSHMQQSQINVEHGHITQKTPSHTKVTERKIASVSFNLLGTKVCKTTYLFAHGIGQKRYKNLCKHFDSNGVTQRIHKNTGKRPSNAYTLEDEKHVVTFIRNFAEFRHAFTRTHATNERLYCHD